MAVPPVSREPLPTSMATLPPPGQEPSAVKPGQGPVPAPVTFDPALMALLAQSMMPATLTDATTAGRPLTIIFQPTIVIIQNNVTMPASMLQSYQNVSSPQMVLMPQLVNVQNQEVFIYPNALTVTNMSASYVQANPPASTDSSTAPNDGSPEANTQSFFQPIP